jgi:hypothetical protein
MGTAAKPQTLWKSATADFHNFRRGVNEADGFTRDLAGSESSPIVFGVSLGQGLIIGKQSEEWLGSSTDGQASISPTNFNARRQSSYGAADVAPIVVGPRLVFARSGGRVLNDYQYAWDTQEFGAAELNELSDHLFISGIKQLAYQRRPDSIIWAVTNDGKLLSLHYRREKEFIAWAYHKMSGDVDSVACIPGDNDLDDVYILAQRNVGGTDYRYVEQIDTQTMFELEEDDIDEAEQRALLTYLDCSVFQTGAASATWTGFDHLEGELLSVQADGSYHAPVRVLGGGITLSRTATSVLGGIDYSDDSPLQPMNFDIGSRDGSSVGKTWRVAGLHFHFYKTSGARFADDENARFVDVKLRTSAGDVNAPVALTSGVIQVGTAPRYQDSVRVVLKPISGEPLNLLAFIPDLSISG